MTELQSRNTIRVYLHLVWATYQRYPIISEDREATLLRCIETECTRMGCEVLTSGAMPDHVHVALTLPTTLSMAKLVQRIKGVSSAFARDNIFKDEFFGWQDGYGAFSFSLTQCDAVVQYIKNQKTHHAENKLWPAIENACPAPTPSSSPSGTDG